MGSLVIKTGRSDGSLLPYFYQFQCHYPLTTYLTYLTFRSKEAVEVFGASNVILSVEVIEDTEVYRTS